MPLLYQGLLKVGMMKEHTLFRKCYCHDLRCLRCPHLSSFVLFFVLRYCTESSEKSAQVNFLILSREQQFQSQSQLTLNVTCGLFG